VRSNAHDAIHSAPSVEVDPSRLRRPAVGFSLDNGAASSDSTRDAQGRPIRKQGDPMNKGDFVGGMQVQPVLGSAQVMTLGGSEDDWVCTWIENGQKMTKHFQPEQLQLATVNRSSK